MLFLKQITMHTCEDFRQIGRMKHVFLLIYTVGALLFSVNGICLTWNATADNVFIKCHVFSNFTAEHEILLMDSFHQLRTKCYNYGSPYCRGRENWDIIMDESTENGFSFVLQTAKKNVEGEWKCSHGSDKANVYIHLMKGTVYSVDTHLTGEVVEKTAYNKKFKLTCFSCWAPDTESANFFVNDVLEDSIRYKDGNCYRKRNLCSLSECTCSNKGKHFTWSFISNLSFIELSCEMRFTDEETSNFSIQTANIMYNESGFQQKITTKKIISASDKDIYTDTTNADQSLLFIAVVAFTSTVTINVILIGMWVGCTLLLKKIRPGVLPLISLLRTCKVPVKKDADQVTENILLRERRTDGSFSQILCDKCGEIPVCTMCINCRNIYCNDCCDVHAESKGDHKIIHIPHIAANQEIVCGKCVIKKAEQLCAKCLNLMCESCAKSQVHAGCNGNKMMIIYHGHPKLLRQISEKKLNYFKDLSIEKSEERYPIRICGISYVADGSLILVDKINRNLLVFKSNEVKIRTNLEDEPHALTSMTGQHIAITFPFKMEIRIYKISENSIDKLNTISLPALELYNLKPYSIAFDNDFFVVEVGEGDDGMIIVMNDTQIHKEIHNKNFAYFTGHTIRLAVEVKFSSQLEGRIYISALSKNVVLCVDFEGEEIWKVSIPSPRGISVNPEDCIPGNNLVICSRRCNAIFGLNKENGSDKQILLSEDKIKLPRFISYNSKDRLLGIQVAKGVDEDKSVSFVEFSPPIEIIL